MIVEMTFSSLDPITTELDNDVSGYIHIADVDTDSELLLDWMNSTEEDAEEMDFFFDLQSYPEIATQSDPVRRPRGRKPKVKREIVGRTDWTKYPEELRAAAPQPAAGGIPFPGRDERAPKDRDKVPCHACSNSRPRSDWTHTRKIGECWYPYDKPVVPD